LAAGNYTIEAEKGSDGNTLLNPCNNALVLPSKQVAFAIAPDTVIENKSICNEQLPYVWNNITVTAGGNQAAVYTTVSSNGCDSTTILNLNVSAPLAQSTLSGTICANQSYTLPWDSTVTSAGTYTHLYKNIAGCDSLVEQVILKDAPGSVTESMSLCNEQLPYVWNGITVTKGGDQAAVYTTASSTGCDSITILNLVVNAPPAQNTVTKTICSGQPYTLPWDSTVISAGTYTHVYKNKAGCDSLVESFVLRDSTCLQFVYVPTAFTPNADGKNDIFKPLLSGAFLEYSFIIYNRWGKMIFFSKDPLKGWDGTVNGIQQAVGTYIWICNYQLAGQSVYTQKGTVTLIR
jgi:gliding motility-associated-like protein